MNWNAAREDEGRVLKRIVAMLYAFAALAERASTRHLLVRATVLWILRFAETIAWEFVLDEAMQQGASLTPAVLLIPTAHGGDSPADAMRLARSFRALAVMLERLADGNPGGRQMRIARLCITLTACAAHFHLPAGMASPRSLALHAFAVERRDSS